MSYWPHLMAALVGAGITIQVGMNATVRMTIGSPVLAAIVNFVVGLAALVLLAVASGARIVPGSAEAELAARRRNGRLPSRVAGSG